MVKPHLFEKAFAFEMEHQDISRCSADSLNVIIDGIHILVAGRVDMSLKSLVNAFDPFVEKQINSCKLNPTFHQTVRHLNANVDLFCAAFLAFECSHTFPFNNAIRQPQQCSICMNESKALQFRCSSSVWPRANRTLTH